jgi:hypothetical protein
MRARGGKRVLLGAVIALLGGVVPAGAVKPAPVAKIALGQSAFWKGGVRAATMVPDDIWATVYSYHDYYRDYPIQILQPGYRLRFGLNHPSYRQYFWIEVFDPDGNYVNWYDGWMSLEAFIDKPKAGTWLVRVHQSEGGDTNFVMRAKLEGAPGPRPDSPRRLLPNLRLIPPFELTFHTPLDAFWLSSRYGARSPDSYAVTCSADDTAQYDGHRCLRFSLGPANTGPGPFQMRFESLQGLATEGRAWQRLYDTDGAFVERPAGFFQYHLTHMHYHHTGMGSLELWRVTDAKKGRMVLAGHGPKQGFCTADVVMFDFSRFDQAAWNSTESTCVSDSTPIGTYGPTGTIMGITPGWADIYGWSQDGNYVEFGDNPDGLYVVRSTTDVENFVLESNENDNTSYAYIEVKGNSVRVIERGFGRSPFDPAKQPAHDMLQSTPAGFE